ncbi:unnamed protein product, partial [Mycena citricolor]
EGRLSLREMGEGGRADTTICLDTTLLWIRDERNPTCPSSLQFSLKLPATFGLSGQTFPLPPSHSIKLKGLPGFYADIEYSVSAVINKPRALPNIVPLVKSKKLGINIGNTTVSTPFIYYPRTRPGVALPSPMQHVATGFIEAPGWKVYNYMVKANNRTGAQNINVKLYLPGNYLPLPPTASQPRTRFQHPASSVRLRPFHSTRHSKLGMRSRLPRSSRMRQWPAGRELRPGSK